jgi:uncharacterized membrane protein YphA (DoxX/SURF4 family)
VKTRAKGNCVSDMRRVAFVGILFAVILRMAIGWQFFYEGLWKYETLDTAKPWTSAGYLTNARGPFRDHFRGMVNDPDELGWLDYEIVNTRWEKWTEEFTEFYELTDGQKKDLAVMLDGPDEIVGRSRVPEIAKGIKIGGSLAREKIIELRQENEPGKNRFYLVVNGEQHLVPRERDSLLRMAKKLETQALEDAKAAEKDSPEAKTAKRQAALADAFARAVTDVYKRNIKLGNRERLASLLKGDPERVSRIREDQAPGTVDHKRPGKVKEYKDRLARYEVMLADARQEFQQDHLNKEQARIRELKAELVGPVKQLEADTKRKARGILTAEQLANGALPKTTVEKIDRIDTATMWALMIMGVMMIVGLFSRVMALAGAGLVLSFYLVMPPWPGVPAAPGPEHSLIVNKNLIEILALLMLATVPTGKWFGLDALCGWFFSGGKQTRPKRQKKTSSARPPKSPVEEVSLEEIEEKEPATPPKAPKDSYAIRPSGGKK